MATTRSNGKIENVLEYVANLDCDDFMRVCDAYQGNWQTIDEAEADLRSVFGDENGNKRPDFFVYRGGRHVALHKRNKNGKPSEHRTMLVREVGEPGCDTGLVDLELARHNALSQRK